MNSRRILAVLMAIMLVFGVVVACTGNKPAEVKPTDPPAQPNTPTSKPDEQSTVIVDDGKTAEEDKYGGVFVWAQSSDPNTLLYAWITSGWTNRMSSFLNDKLFVFDQEGNLHYRICDDIQLSDDGLVYTFHIRDGVKWHDGTPVLASDIVWTNNVQYDPNWFMALQFENPGKWEVVDDQTFTVTLDEPTPTALQTISDLMFPQPEHYWADVEPANFFSCDKATKPIGCGPFKFVEYKVGDYLKMEAFEDFWNGRPYLDEAYIKITGGGTYTNLAFEAGEVSAITVAEDYYEEIKDNPQFQFYVGSSTNLAGVFPELYTYSHKDTSSEVICPTGDVNFRRALAYAIPYDEMINKVLRGACTRSYSVVPADCQFFTEEGIDRYEYDLDKANQILDEAGYIDTDGNGIRNYPGGGADVILFWTYYGTGTNETMSIVMAEQTQKLGILSGVKTEEQTTWVDTLLGEGKEFDPNTVPTCAVYYYGGYGAIAYDYENMYASWGGQSPFIDWDTGEVLPREELIRMYGEETMAIQDRIDDCFRRMHTVNEDDARAAFEEFQRIKLNEQAGILPIGTMIKRIGFQSNIRGIDEAIFLTNNNYLGFAMEKIWIDKNAN